MAAAYRHLADVYDNQSDIYNFMKYGFSLRLFKSAALIRLYCSVADPDPVGSGPFWSDPVKNRPDPQHCCTSEIANVYDKQSDSPPIIV
jgi:hypothetical protein